MNRYGECRAMTSESNYWQGCTSATATFTAAVHAGAPRHAVSAVGARRRSIADQARNAAAKGIRLPPRAAEHGEAFRNAQGAGSAFTIYTDGSQGSEADVVRRMRVGQLNAAMMSVIGLSEIAPSVNTLQKMPMVFRSWEELDFVSQTLRPAIERRFRDKGFVVALWAEAGWVRFFCKEPRHARRI